MFRVWGWYHASGIVGVASDFRGFEVFRLDYPSYSLLPGRGTTVCSGFWGFGLGAKFSGSDGPNGRWFFDKRLKYKFCGEIQYTQEAKYPLLKKGLLRYSGKENGNYYRSTLGHGFWGLVQMVSSSQETGQQSLCLH